MERVSIFDTTLRDGEQSPGATMTPGEKLRMARRLADLRVDVIEAGFPVASEDDYLAVRKIAREVKGPTICALARANPRDVDRAGAALAGAERARIHVFIATSDLHLEQKLGIGREECVERAAEAVSRAHRHVGQVEFSAEDATRTDRDFLCRVLEAAVDAGATTVNVPDTVGYSCPSEIRELISLIRRRVPGLADVELSVHCHDDLGFAVANSVAAVQAGARQVECTVNGIGERAGNAALEEIVMALEVRRDRLPYRTGVTTREIYRASRLLSRLTGIHPQPNKAVVGENAFSHEAGIHQHGVLQDRSTYEIMTPDMVGAPETRLVLGKHSGRHALADRYRSLGYDLAPEDLDRAYRLFSSLADQKKEVLDEDLLSILYHDVMQDVPVVYALEGLDVRCGEEPSRARVSVRVEGTLVREAEGGGDGPVAATFAALGEVVDPSVELRDFEVRAATPGRDARAEANIQAEVDGKSLTGRGASTDSVRAAALAYLHAVNKAEHARTLEAEALSAANDLWGV